MTNHSSEQKESSTRGQSLIISLGTQTLARIDDFMREGIENKIIVQIIRGLNKEHKG